MTKLTNLVFLLSSSTTYLLTCCDRAWCVHLPVYLIVCLQPEYAFPDNCYSDNVNLTRILGQIATVAGTIGAVEEALLVAKRPRARVAIVVARSSSFWDAWESTGGPTLVGVTASLMAINEVYNAEVFALWKMLTLEFNIPVDFLSEDSLSGFISLPTMQLSDYSTIFITEPNLPEQALHGATAWVQQGSNRTLLLSPFAGQFDAFAAYPCNCPDDVNASQ